MPVPGEEDGNSARAAEIHDGVQGGENRSGDRCEVVLHVDHEKRDGSRVRVSKSDLVLGVGHSTRRPKGQVEMSESSQSAEFR